MGSISGIKKRKKKESLKKGLKVFIRMNYTEYAIILANAQKYTKGNVSKWIRERSCNPMLDVSIEMQDQIDEGNIFDEI